MTTILDSNALNEWIDQVGEKAPNGTRLIPDHALRDLFAGKVLIRAPFALSNDIDDLPCPKCKIPWSCCDCEPRPLPPQSPKAESGETWTCDYCSRQVPEGNDEVWLGKNRCFCSVACLENYQARFDESDTADKQAGEQEKKV